MTDTKAAETVSESSAAVEAAVLGDGSQREALAEFWRVKTKRILTLVGILVAVVAMFVVAMLVGPLNISAADIASTYLKEIVEGLQQLGIDAGWVAETSGRARTVVMELRTPPTLMAVVAGAALALAGAQMQTILDNPLAEPYTFDVSVAAGCGAAIVTATGISFPLFSEASVPIGAAALALVANGVIALVSRLWRSGRETIILSGTALVFGFQALLVLLQYRTSQESLQRMVFWTMGSLERTTWFSIAMALVSLIVVIPPFLMNQWKLTALSLGETRARAMGVKVDNVRVWTLLGASLIATLTVSSIGIIGFVGLVDPHVARILVGEDQRLFVPTAMACGTPVLTSAHAVAQIVVPGVALPVDILTALVGVPMFVLITLGRRRTTSAISNQTTFTRRGPGLMFNLESISVSYGKHAVLSGLDPAIKEGVVAGLLGPSGCGKSTLVRSIAGAQHCHGSVSYGKRSGRALQDVIGYMPQEIPGHIVLTAMESVLVSAQHGGLAWWVPKKGVERVYAALNVLGIGKLANACLEECSGGQWQLISLTQTLVHGPESVLLDEPTSALDLKHQVRVLRSVRKHVHGSETTVAEKLNGKDTDAGESSSRLALVVLHDINLATRFCDEVMPMTAGEVVAQGTSHEVCTSENLSRVYNTEVAVNMDEEGVLTVVAR